VNIYEAQRPKKSKTKKEKKEVNAVRLETNKNNGFTPSSPRDHRKKY